MRKRPHIKNYFSIIIPTKDRPEPLKKTLEQINKLKSSSFEVIVVDSSEKNQKETINEYLKKTDYSYNFQYIESDFARSSHQRNIGVDHAIGDIIVFIDDDFDLDVNLLKKIRTVVNNDSSVGGGQANFHINRSLPTKIIESVFFTNGYSPFGNGNIKLSGAFQSKKPVEKPTRIRCVGTGCCFYKKEVFDYFRIDPTIPTSCASDLEFSCRVSKKYPLYLFPQLKCTHKHFKSGKPDIEDTTSNFIYFQARHFKRLFFNWWRVPFFLWSQVGYLIRYISLTISKNEPKYIRGWSQGVGRVLRKIWAKP